MPIKTNLRNTKLKTGLLEKSGAKRQRHADEVRLHNVAAKVGRNDLLPELAIVMRPVESLKNANRRTRKPTADQLERVTASLKSFGIVTPLLIDTDDRLIAGHIVRDAARQLGLREVPCVIIDHLGADERRLLGVALNRIAETGSWDLDLLKLELGDLELAGLGLGVTGFSLPELDIVLGESAEDRADEVEPQPDEDTPVVSRLGDIWHLGPHRIVCGDALDGESYARLLEGRLAQGVFSDPPYNCPIEGFVSGLGKAQHKDFAMAVGEMSDEAFHDFLATYLLHCKAHLSAGAVIFACMDWRQNSQGVGVLDNAAAARLYGLELTGEFAASDDLRLVFGLGVEHATYKDYAGAVYYVPSPSGGNYTITSNASGNRLVRAPKVTANLGATYTVDLGSSGSLELNGSVAYQGSYFWDIGNVFKQGGYALVDGSIKYISPDKHWSVSVWGKNITNHVYAIYVNPQTRYTAAAFGDPATYGVTAGFKF